MRHILACLDPSPSALDVLRAAVDLASATDARVSALRVIEGAGAEPELSGVLRSAAKEDLRALASAVPPCRLERIYARKGTAWEGISKAARHVDADLIAIGASRHGPLRRVLGTTAASSASN